MEYLNSINDGLSSINDDNYEYVNIFEYPQFIFGNINFSMEKTNFCKVPRVVRDESKNFGDIAVQEMNNLYNSPTGNRLRFFTNSKKVIFRIKLKRKWGYQKMLNCNALGFDVYNVIGDNYIHMGVFAPKDGFNIFAESINTPDNGRVCVFLPSYNVIEELYVGIEKGSEILEMDYFPIEKKLPIIFYGNSITQGTAASRSGNIFPNIVSRKLNQDIINLSVSFGCRGSIHIADLIGKINCSSIVIDYTRNASSSEELFENYERFYRRIRFFHPNKKIILMTSSNFNNWKRYDEFDEVVITTYVNAVIRGENTEIIYQKEIFDEVEYDYMTIDGTHYTDHGMFKIADEIIKKLNCDSPSVDFIDTWFSDDGIFGRNSDDWYDVSDNIKVQHLSDGTIISNETNSTGLYLANKPDYQLGWTNTFNWRSPFIMEVDIVEYHNDVSFRIAETTGGEYNISFNDLGINNNNHVKLVNDGLSFEFYVNGIHINSKSVFRPSDISQLGFRIVNGYLKYKNFVIY